MNLVGAQVLVNEVGSSGALNTCGGTNVENGEDFIELFNMGSAAVSLENYVLYDNNGPLDSSALVLDSSFSMEPGEIVLLCRNIEDFFFEFGIGGTDTVSLNDPLGNVVSTTEAFPFGGDEFNTYQYNMKTDEYLYAAPTPGEANIFQGAQVFINEVADKAVLGVCNDEDYIELINAGPNPADITNFVLHDNKGPTDPDVYVFNDTTIIPPQSFFLLCAQETFLFGVGGTDTVTLLDAAGAMVSTAGPLAGSGSDVITYNRHPDGTYVYSVPTPGEANIFLSPSYLAVAVNEVGNAGTFGVCGGDGVSTGEDFVELFNPSTTEAISLTGWVLYDDNGPMDIGAFLFDGQIIGPFEFLLLCRNFEGSFGFGIGGSDLVGLVDENGFLVSTSGPLQGRGTELITWQRRPDNTYAYSDPTPGAENVFAPDSVDVIITEISNSGAFDACGGDDDVAGNDYVEFLNTGSNPADLSGFILHDSSGPDDAAAFTFPEGTVLEPAAYLLVCGGETFTFDMEGSVTVTLLDTSAQLLSSVGPLTLGGTPGVSYQRKRDGTFVYNDASPGTKNIIPGVYFGTVIVTEISNTGFFSTCGGDAQNAGADYVELFNTGDMEFDLSGFILHDDKGSDNPDATPLADGTLIEAGGYLLLCSGVQFPFGIGGDDAITLLDPTGDFVSESGPLSGQGTVNLSYQRVDDLTSSPTWTYGFPSPGAMNNPDIVGIVRISEVAPMGSLGACNGEAWVELFNDGFGVVNIAGFVLSDTSGAGEYTFPEFVLAARAFAVVCAVETFQFAIQEGDTVTLSDAMGIFLSDTGVIGKGETAPSAMAIWALKADVSQTATPFDPFFTYSKDATPGYLNVFPFEKVDLPIQACGVASKSYPAPEQLVYQETLTFGENPEFSGGSFYGGTCSHFVFGDEGTVREFSVDANGLKEVRSIRLVGGSGDTEGSCFYTDDSGTSLVYVDERERSVAICDLPTVEQGSVIYRESSNCKVIGLTDIQKSDPTQTSANSNEGFEGVACDPANHKLYVVQEKNPMRIWSVDIAAETFTTLIDVENLESWTSLVTDLAGVSIVDSFCALRVQSATSPHSNAPRLFLDRFRLILSMRRYTSCLTKASLSLRQHWRARLLEHPWMSRWPRSPRAYTSSLSLVRCGFPPNPTKYISSWQ